MLTHLAQLAPDVVTAARGLNTNGITNWLATNIIPILLAVIGLIIIAGARKGRFSEVFGTLSIVMVGLVLFLGAGAFMAFGNQIVNVVFG